MMLFSAICFLLLETEKYGRVRAVFDGRPWKNMKGLMEEPDNATSVESKIKMCPFTGQEAHGTCPICHSIVSYDGYYRVSTLMQCLPTQTQSTRRGIHQFYTQLPVIPFLSTDSLCKRVRATINLDLDEFSSIRSSSIEETFYLRRLVLLVRVATSKLGAGQSAIVWFGNPLF